MLSRVLLLGGLMVHSSALLAGNTPPTPQSPSVYVALGQQSYAYDVENGFSDPDGDDISSVGINGVTGSATVGILGPIITITPSNPNLATPAGSAYVVSFKVCDDGVPSECADATLSLFYNDPPTLSPIAQSIPSGGSVSVNFNQFYVSAGVLHGDNPSDGDTDAVASTLVSNSAVGVFSTMASLGGGGNCSVTGTDTSNVSFTAPIATEEVVKVCYVRICEELPVATLAVCTVTTITMTVIPPQLLKDGFEDPP